MKHTLYLLTILLLSSCSHRGFNTVRVSPSPSQPTIEKPATAFAATDSMYTPSIPKIAATTLSEQKEPATEKPAVTRQRFDKSKLGKAFKISGGVVMAGGFAVFLLGHKQSAQGTLTLKNIIKQIAATSLMMTGLIIIGAGLLLLLIGVIIYRRNTYSTQGNRPLY